MARTDGDTWDLATSVGTTATMVAAARAVATNAPEPAISDPFAEPLVRAVGVEFLTKWASGEVTSAEIDGGNPDFPMGALPDMMAARTRYFDQFLTDAAERGVRQLVILASGLDARAYRLDWPAGTVIYEIDLPDVIEFKTTTLAELGAAPRADRRAVPVDLRDDWPAALRSAGFDPSSPSAWIAEGLLGYLPPAAQDRLLDDVNRLATPGSAVATEVVPGYSEDTMEQARERMRPATEKLREHGLDLDFTELTYDGERNDVDRYLGERGWTSVGTPMPDLLAEHGLPALPDGNGIATMADIVYYTSRNSDTV